MTSFEGATKLKIGMEFSNRLRLYKSSPAYVVSRNLFLECNRI